MRFSAFYVTEQLKKGMKTFRFLFLSINNCSILSEVNLLRAFVIEKTLKSGSRALKAFSFILFLLALQRNRETVSTEKPFISVNFTPAPPKTQIKASLKKKKKQKKVRKQVV